MAIHEAGHAAASHVYLGDDLLSTRLSIRKRGGSLGHHQSMEKEERFSHFRSYYMGQLIWILGAMAAEHVFYGENSAGRRRRCPVGDGDRRLDGRHVGDGPRAGSPRRDRCGPDAVDDADAGGQDARAADEADDVLRRLERIGSRIMNRASGPGPFAENPLGAILGDRTSSAPPPS